MPANLLSVNVNSYRKYREGAFAHLERIGVHHVEIPVPGAEELDEVRRQLQEHGLKPASLICPCDLTTDAELMREKLEIAREMRVRLFFISAKTGELSKPEAYARLRERCTLAEEYDVTLSLETHPPLAENATEARATLHAVGHRRLRWNLDTANLYYYNQNLDAAEQARRGLDLVGSVHLKDTNGSYQCWWFPALGDGVVSFASVFRVLNERAFHGPFTIEIEGIQGEELDEAAVQERVTRSVRHLRDLGLV
jgi:L-ribulose-5-phosphate 3-epimerase